MDSNALKSDIDYLKSLALDGGRAPVMNGGALFWAGICFSAAAVVQYLVMDGVLTVPNPWFLALNWGAAAAIYAVLCIASITASKRRYGVGNAMNRAIGSVWSGVGFAIFALFITLNAAAVGMKAMEQMTPLFAPAIVILYGVGWWVASVLSGRKWMGFVGLLSFASAPFLAFVGGQPIQMLGYAITLTLIATIPGLVLMRSSEG